MTRRALLLAAGIALALHYVAMRLVDGWRPEPEGVGT